MPGRKNIVLTFPPLFEAPGVTTVLTPEEALDLVKDEEEVFIIGGASIYKLFLSQADRLYLTEAEAEDPDADVFFPAFDKSEWTRTVLGEGGTDIPYVHVLYERKEAAGNRQ